LAVSAPVDWLPLSALEPAQLPEAVQTVALFEDQLIKELPPLVRLLGLTMIDTVGAGGVTVTVVD